MQFTFAGISRDEIIQRSASEIIAKIKQNMKAQSKNVHAQKILRLRKKIEDAQVLLKLQEECEEARKEAELKKDTESLRAYEKLKIQMAMLGEQIDATHTDRSLLDEFGTQQAPAYGSLIQMNNFQIENIQHPGGSSNNYSK